MALKDFIKKNFKKIGLASTLFVGSTSAAQASYPKAKPVRAAEDSLYPPIVMTNDNENIVDVMKIAGNVTGIEDTLDLSQKEIDIYKRVIGRFEILIKEEEEKQTGQKAVMPPEEIRDIIKDVRGDPKGNAAEEGLQAETLKSILNAIKYGEGIEGLKTELVAKEMTLNILKSLQSKAKPEIAPARPISRFITIPPQTNEKDATA